MASFTPSGSSSASSNQNAAALQHFRERYANATANNLNMLVIGDSITEGVNSATRPARWINLIKDYISSGVGVTSMSSGYIPLKQAGGALANSFTGDAGTLGANGLGKRSWQSAAGITNSRTITTDQPFDHLQIYYNKGSTYGTFTITVDGNLVATVDCHQAAAGPTMAVWDSGLDFAFANGHTLTIATTNTGTVSTFFVDIAGIQPYLGNNGTGVVLWEAGHSSFPSWVPAGQELAQITLINPDIVFLAYGVNDPAFLFTPVNTATDFGQTVTAIKGALSTECSFVFVDMWGNGGSAESNWIPFHDAIAAQSIASGAALVDIYKELGYQGGSTALGDHLHPDANGCKAFADTAMRVLNDNPSASQVNKIGDIMTGELIFDFGAEGIVRIKPDIRGPAITVEYQGDVGFRASIGKTFVAGSDFPAFIMSDGGNDTTKYEYLFRGTSNLWTLSNAALKASVVNAIKTITTTNYTLVIGDAGAVIDINATANNNVTIPPNSSVAFPIGTAISLNLRSAAPNTSTVVAGAGVTLEIPPSMGATLSEQFSSITAIQRAANVWQLVEPSDLSRFLLLAGRLGGQTINGGTANSDGITINANSGNSLGPMILNSFTATINTAVFTINGVTTINGGAAGTGGDPGGVLAVVGTATNDDPTEQTSMSRITTTDATITTLATFSNFIFQEAETLMVEVKVIARRFGGTSGGGGDTASYGRVATFKKLAGVVTQVGSTTALWDHETAGQTAWDVTFDINANVPRLRVVGAANNSLVWHGIIKYSTVGI